MPLVTAPASPARPAVTYDENGVTIAWPAPAQAGAAPEPPPVRVCESRPIGCSAPTVGYHVYEVASAQTETRLTDQPVAGPRVRRPADRLGRRALLHRARGPLARRAVVESEPAPPRVRDARSTRFRRRRPKGLVAVASEGAINLIWDANAETDLAGYLVLRAPRRDQGFTPVTPSADPRHDASPTRCRPARRSSTRSRRSTRPATAALRPPKARPSPRASPFS